MRNLECPIAAAEREIQGLGSVTALLIDVHGEATSEKQALGWYFAGRVAAVIGTHTHVQTADERILPGGTAFITDVGMTGPHDSVIGMETEAAIQRLLTQRHAGHQVASKNVILCGVVIDIDDATGRATHIERVREAWQS
jgi:metallophosphoesterase (TIGR00282 family)